MNQYDTLISLAASTMKELDDMVTPTMNKWSELYFANKLKLNTEKATLQFNGSDMKHSLEKGIFYSAHR